MRLIHLCTSSYSRCGMNRMWILKNFKYLLKRIQFKLSSCKTLNHLTYLPFTHLFHTLHWRKNYKKFNFVSYRNRQGRHKYLVLEMDNSFFGKTFSVLLIAYSLSLVDVFFDRQSTFLWVPTVLLFSSSYHHNIANIVESGVKHCNPLYKPGSVIDGWFLMILHPSLIC